jgi:3-hydroxybutyrate dehydrogenase
MDPKEITIVTGGGRGIGRAIALRMAQETAVFIVGRTEKDLIDVRTEIFARGGFAAYVVGDVTEPLIAMTVADICSARGWSIRNLVCNAGMGKGAYTHEYEPELWQSIMDVNVRGTFLFLKACLPPMRERKQGTVCVISSLSGLAGSSLNAPYVAAKHAQVGLVKTLAKEYGKDGIVSVAICPGYVLTEMTERSIQKRMQLHGLTREQAIEKITKTNPQHRIIPPEEVAEMVAFVCSGKVPSLSGSALVMSGGV